MNIKMQNRRLKKAERNNKKRKVFIKARNRINNNIPKDRRNKYDATRKGLNGITIKAPKIKND